MKQKRQIRAIRRAEQSAQRGWSCFWHWPWGHVWMGDATPTDTYEGCGVPRCTAIHYVGGY